MKLLPAFTGAPEVNRVYQCDLFTLCAAMLPGSVDMILCDLPYGTTACAWDTVIPFAPMWAAFKRVIKPRGAIVLTASQPFTSALVMSNPEMFKYCWVWNKKRPADWHAGNYRPLTQHEDICVFSFGTCAQGGKTQMSYYPAMTARAKPITVRSGGYETQTKNPKGQARQETIKTLTEFYPKTILEFYNGTQQEAYHPTQKPTALFEYLIRTYTQPGELVFDPCVGSGTTAIAARQCGRSFVCGDSSQEYIEVARERLTQPYTLPMFETLPVESEAS